MTERSIVRVADVMEPNYAIIDGAATVAQAITLMREKDAYLLVVAKRDEEDEFGVVLVADIAKNVLANDRSPERTNVYEIMSKPALSVRSGMHIRYCARLFYRFGISAAPVIDNDEVRGVVAYDHLVLEGLAKQGWT